LLTVDGQRRVVDLADGGRTARVAEESTRE
jgi:hypothetical protein